MQKIISIKPVLVLATLITTSYTGIVSAHTLTGTVAAGKTDIVNFQCFTDTNLSTSDDGTTSNFPAQQVFIDLTKGAVTAALGHIDQIFPSDQHWIRQVVDSSTAVGGVSLTPPVGKTSGIWSSKGYSLSVSNGTTVTQTYSVSFHCRRIGGAHTGTGALITSATTDPSVDYTVVVNQ